MQSNKLVNLLFLVSFACLAGIYARPVSSTTPRFQISTLKDQNTTESRVPNDLKTNGLKDMQINTISSIQKSTNLKGTTEKTTPIYREKSTIISTEKLTPISTEKFTPIYKGKSIPISREKSTPIFTEKPTIITTESTTEGPGYSQRNPAKIGPRLSATLLKVLTK